MRRLRVLGRYARYATHPALLPRGLYVPTYWWDQQRNFGDQLTPALLPEHGIAPVHARPSHAALAGVGSLVEHLPQDYRGTFWGSGMMFDRKISFPEATFAAVRGRLSAQNLGLHEGVATGDPGLLIAPGGRVRQEKVHPVLVPHYRHWGDDLWDRLQVHLGPGTRKVDVRARPSEVARQIAQADVVITSSLHGLITADALGVPAAWVLPRPWGEGGAFKFLDYESNFDRTWERQVRVSAPMSSFADSALASSPARVESLRQGLLKALEDVRTQPSWTVYSQPPLVAVMARRSYGPWGSPGNQWPTEPVIVRPRGG